MARRGVPQVTEFLPKRVFDCLELVEITGKIFEG